MAKTDEESRDETPSQGNELRVLANGPLIARGNLEVQDAPHDGVTTKMDRAAFCRCGHSKNKPFCDGSHKIQKFCEAGTFESGGEGFENTSAPVLITRKKKGSLKFHGPVSVVSADGKSCWRSSYVKICRCGKSKTQPFCDDTHREVGFDETK